MKNIHEDLVQLPGRPEDRAVRVIVLMQADAMFELTRQQVQAHIQAFVHVHVRRCFAAGMGKRAFVVTGQNLERAGPLLQDMKKQGIEYATFGVTGEPTTTIAQTGIEKARLAKSDLVIGIGGGSALDTGKVISAMLTNTGELEDYLEVVGHGKPLIQNPVPYIAIPTTAGTGAEVTRNAVLGVPKHQVKVSLRSPLLPPRLAVVDPGRRPSLEAYTSTGVDQFSPAVGTRSSTSAQRTAAQASSFPSTWEALWPCARSATVRGIGTRTCLTPDCSDSHTTSCSQ